MKQHRQVPTADNLSEAGIYESLENQDIQEENEGGRLDTAITSESRMRE